MVAGSPTPDGREPEPLRVRLDGPAELGARAAWALEALLARCRVVAWELVEAGAEADLVWGAGADLPHDPIAWTFRWDAPPDPVRDPLAATFWWLAREEERLAPADAFDAHGRFRADVAAMARLAEPLSAPVDDLALELAPRLERWRREPADGEPAWRVVLTHDIDLPWRWTRSGRRRALRQLRDAVRRGRVGPALRVLGALAAAPVWRLRGRDPWCNRHRIRRLEARLGATSTSYLLLGDHAPEDGDAAAYLERWVKGRPGEFVPDGAFGLHGSYTSSTVAGRLEVERVELTRRTGVDARDHRFHYLRHRPVEAWPLLDRAGIRSDASLGFAERPGFRAGTAHPFRAWDHDAGAPLDLVVVPLACMDASFDARYLDITTPAERRRRVIEVIDAIGWYDGAASLLVHNDRLCNVADDGWTRLYRAVLRHVRHGRGSACTAHDAANAYRALLPAHRSGAAAAQVPASNL